MKNKPRLAPVGLDAVVKSGVYFGLYDPSDCVWLGDDKGPRIYDNELAAKLAATITTAQLGTLIQPIEYDFGIKKLKDRVDTKMSALEAIKHMESGGI